MTTQKEKDTLMTEGAQEAIEWLLESIPEIIDTDAYHHYFSDELRGN